jgi:uncharacterized protein (TIGR03083 family)
LAQAHADEVDRRPPATPDWRIHDLLAHLTGVATDVVAGNLEGVGTDPWTAQQVELRRDWTLDELLAAWDTEGTALDAVIDSLPPGTFGQLLFDTWTHEQDLRGALATPGARDSAAAGAWAWVMAQLEARDAAEANPALVLVTERDKRVLGVEPTAATVRASQFELLRAMTGRRSVDQIHAYDWDGDPLVERIVLVPLFHPADAALIE